MSANNKVLLFNPRSANSKFRLPNSLLAVAAAINQKFEWVIVDGNREVNPEITILNYLNTGDFVYVSGINSTVANGIYYVTVTGVNTFALFTNVTMATPYDSRLTSAYVSGGTVSAGLYTAQGTAIPGEITLSSANGPTNNYENDKNLILPTSKVQDSYYYQDYSYVVRSGVSFENWKPYFNKLVHPAGIAVFGEVDYANVNSGQVLMGNTEVVNNQINNTKTTTSTTVTIT